MTKSTITYDIAKGADLHLTWAEVAAAREAPTLIDEHGSDRLTVNLFQEGLVAVRGDSGGRLAFVVLDPHQYRGGDDDALIAAAQPLLERALQ